jgi:biopolymer transport protein ExbD
MDYFRRLDLFLLAFMLACVVVIVIRSSFRLRRGGCPILRGFRREGMVSQASPRSLRELLADLRRAARTLKAIAYTAPFLGLVGTCEGILNASFLSLGMTISDMSAAPITTAAGVLVAIPAIASYHYLCTRTTWLEGELPYEGSDWRSRAARRFPLTKRFSRLPAFALMAAPLLAIALAAYMVFPSFYFSRGLRVGLAPARCPSDGVDRVIVLRITGEGKLFLNFEQEDRDKLAFRLSQIYRPRVHRTVYLQADDDVPFQTVADAIDIAQNTDNLHITVELVTPKAADAPCPDKFWVGARQRASR